MRPSWSEATALSDCTLCCTSLTMPRPRHAAIPRLIGTTGARGEVESVWAEAAVLSDQEALRLLGACSVRCGEFE